MNSKWLAFLGPLCALTVILYPRIVRAECSNRTVNEHGTAFHISGLTDELTEEFKGVSHVYLVVSAIPTRYAESNQDDIPAVVQIKNLERLGTRVLVKNVIPCVNAKAVEVMKTSQTGTQLLDKSALTALIKITYLIGTNGKEVQVDENKPSLAIVGISLFRYSSITPFHLNKEIVDIVSLEKSEGEIQAHLARLLESQFKPHWKLTEIK